MMKRRRIVLWTLLALFLALIVWAVASNNPFAQGIQDLLGSKPDRPILDKQFAIAAHSFRYYQFDVPERSKKVAVVGHFTISVRTNPGDRAERGQDSGGDIEVYVLSESAFADWQRGSTAASVYDSGRISQSKVHKDLPGAGAYYLVFSNKFDPTASKTINATISLRYRSWLPDWLRRNRLD
jgi:hypothetical protein